MFQRLFNKTSAWKVLVVLVQELETGD